jgi:exodeoxyribonuclease X
VSQYVIRVVDFETTGMEPPAEVVEVGFCDLTRQGDGFWTVGEPQSRLCSVAAIPPEVRAVHHISLAETEGCEPFDAARFVEDSDHCAALAAHNMDFENRWLRTDGVMPLICTLKAALRVWPEAPAHNNGTLRYWLEDQGLLQGIDPAACQPAHRAGPDAYVTAWILRELLGRCTGKEMVAWTREPRLLPTCPIGKERGKKWADVDAGFLSWMTAQATMEADLKWNAQRELDRRRGA